jgi:hypothetical protein
MGQCPLQRLLKSINLQFLLTPCLMVKQERIHPYPGIIGDPRHAKPKAMYIRVERA